MSISVKLNKNGIKKLQKELEQEMKKRTIVREGVGLRKEIFENSIGKKRRKWE